MLSNFNFRSKKGISLAVSLTICLFLIMITGGITTVAMLQQNETGSNMNSRQAYISAKSGLDTFKDALKTEGLIDLPSISDDSKYYVLYYDADNKLVAERRDSEEAARDRIKQIVKDGLEVVFVGGEGTYFKVQNKDGKYKVTALNVTGKYNGNVSMNRGDLSFDAVIMTKYTFGLKDPTGGTGGTTPSGMPVPDGPTGSSMAPPIAPPPGPGGEEETLPPPPPPVAPNGIGGSFLMIGQQTCFNEQTGDGDSVSSGNLLSRYYKNCNNIVVYSPSVENAKYGYSYFPIVYDRFVKIESTSDRSSVSAINEGIYFLGEAYGWEEVDEFYAGYKNDPSRTLGKVSYITQNAAYHINLNCKFLCIKNNFVSIGDNDPIVNYCGGENRGYVVAYLPNDVTFYRLDREKNIRKCFTKTKGYYKLANNSLICEPSTWNDPLVEGEPEYQHYVDFNQYDTIMSYYAPVEDANGNQIAGEIHSGCGEDGSITNNVAIVYNNGQFNLNQGSETGYTQSDSFTYNSGRDNQNIFLAPNTGVSQWGTYHWYCGRSFNFQWFRKDDFKVKSDCHIKMSAPTIVLTIGPLVYDTSNKKIEVSNYIEGEKGASFQLYGDKGNPNTSPKLNVMCAFNVRYKDSKGNTRLYPIVAGTYTNVPGGLNLFSEAGEKYFLYQAIAYDLNDASVVVKQPTTTTTSTASSSGSVAAQSISVQTNSIANLFRIFTQRFVACSPILAATIEDNASHEHTLYGALEANTNVDQGITKLYYTDNNMDSDKNVHTLNAVGGRTINKGIAPDKYEAYVVFESGEYKIPANGDSETKINIYDGAELEKRIEWPGSNYKLISKETQQVKIVGDYY